jgi:hypothetical protein
MLISSCHVFNNPHISSDHQPPGEENSSNDAKMMMERMDMDTQNIIDFLV